MEKVNAKKGMSEIAMKNDTAECRRKMVGLHVNHRGMEHR